MMVLGHSEILKLLTGIEERDLEHYFVKMSKFSVTTLRLKVLQELHRSQRGTISFLLDKVGENKSGGTYITINRFFKGLEIEGILEREAVGRRSYWKFSDDAKDFGSYLSLKGV